jgi:hippurate hydrolase
MRGTIRYAREAVGQHLRERVRRIAESTADAYGAEADVEFVAGYPAMTNDPGLTRLIQDCARDLFGPEPVVTDEPLTMGVEDFAFYAQRVPSAIFRLGLRSEHRESYPHLHNSGFDFNDAALPVGMGLFCEITRRFLTHAARQA